MDIVTILTHPIALFFGEPINAFLSIVILVNFALAYRTWISSKKNIVNILFALASLMASVWLVAVLGVRNAPNPGMISVFARVGFVGPVLIALFLNLFSYHFPKGYLLLTLPKKYFVALGVSTVFVLVMTMLPDVLIAGRIQPENRYNPEINLVWQLIFAIYYLVVTFATFRILFYKHKHTDGIWKRRLRQVLIALSVAVFGPIIVALIIPIFYDHSLEWISAIFPLFLVIYIWYNIFYVPNKK